MKKRIAYLEGKAGRIRLHIINSLYRARSGHPGAALSIADLVAALYFDEMSCAGEGRDRFVLSKGHGVAALYGAFAELGWIEEEELNTLRRPGSRLQGHPDMTRLPHLDAGTGALGQGLSISIGYALASVLQGNGARSYCIIGDGECQEGQIWEAAMYAAARKLDNLVAILDANGFQNEESVDDTLPMASLADKWRSFGWNVIELDGHDFTHILSAFASARATPLTPTILVARTVKGRGVPFMEHDNSWHSKTIDESSYLEAVGALTRQVEVLGNRH
jgi:transketolase